MNDSHDKPVELRIHEEVRLEDGLSITVNSFSHKHPLPNGPTQATAHLSITRGGITDEMKLSVHGIQGKTAAQDGLPDSERYEFKRWQEYEFQLAGFDDGRSILLKISRKN